VPSRAHLPLPHLFAGAAIIAAVFLGLSIARNAVRNYQLHEDERVLHAELRQLDADHEQLSAVRDYLESDEYIEDVARRVLGLVRPGETLVIVAGAQDGAVATPEPTHAASAAWWRDLFVAQPTVTPAPAGLPVSGD
jgi:cell division protein FtsB